jgi:hypothetical protein
MTTPKGGTAKDSTRRDLVGLIVEALARGPLTVPVACERFGCEQREARYILRRLVKTEAAREAGMTRRSGLTPPAVIYAGVGVSVAEALDGLADIVPKRSPMTVRRALRAPRAKGSGVIAGKREIRGYRWGWNGGPW